MDMMHPFLIFILALGLPVMFFLLLLGPFYAGICAALYVYYGEQIQEYFYDPAYMIDLYGAVYNYWQQNKALLGFTDFILPVFGPLLVGVLLGLFWCHLFIRYIKSIFHI